MLSILRPHCPYHFHQATHRPTIYSSLPKRLHGFRIALLSGVDIRECLDWSDSHLPKKSAGGSWTRGGRW